MSKSIILLSIQVDAGDEDLRAEALLELERRLARHLIPYELYLTVKKHLEGDEVDSK